MNKIGIVITSTKKELLINNLQYLKKSKAHIYCDIIVSINNPLTNLFKTKKICKDILGNTTNFKCFKTKSFLPVHKSWEFAISKISKINCEWVMMLCEDDIMLENSIITLLKCIKKYPKTSCFSWPVSDLTYNNDNGNFRYHNSLKKIRFSCKNIKTINLKKKIYYNNDIHSIKEISPFFPKILIKRKLLNTPQFFFNAEPMWSSFFRIVFKVKNYRFLNFPIVAIGVSAFSTSSKHKKNKIEKFKKSYFSKIKYLPKIFPKIDKYIFLLSNRFIFIECLFAAKKILGIKFKFNEISLILRVLNEFIYRSVDEKIDYSKEINKLLKLYPDLKYKYDYKKKFFNWRSKLSELVMFRETKNYSSLKKVNNLF